MSSPNVKNKFLDSVELKTCRSIKIQVSKIELLNNTIMYQQKTAKNIIHVMFVYA